MHNLCKSTNPWSEFQKRAYTLLLKSLGYDHLKKKKINALFKKKFISNKRCSFKRFYTLNPGKSIKICSYTILQLSTLIRNYS